MSPQRTKTYAWLFIVMSASVLANILLFQSRQDPKTLAGGGDTRAMRMGAVAPESRSTDQIADTVRAIQRELRELNLFPGQIDGKASPIVHAAIVAYEQAQALPLTGEPSQSLLRDLIVGPSGRSHAGMGLGVVSGSAAERLIRDIRHKLVTLGYPAGSGDSGITLELIQSIRAFERDNGMAQTGRVSAHLMVQLQRSVAAFKPRSG
jgi:peptidoglycan hydrolase-like protein with peptidoglycan-binding domain